MLSVKDRAKTRIAGPFGFAFYQTSPNVKNPNPAPIPKRYTFAEVACLLSSNEVKLHAQCFTLSGLYI